jgi:uncharacterized protein YbjQ (UPF0145 family)
VAITVRSRSVVGNIAGGFMTLFGGRSVIYTELCERTREEALQLMIKHGEELGCNAIKNMRYDANEVMSGLTEVLADTEQRWWWRRCNVVVLAHMRNLYRTNTNDYEQYIKPDLYALHKKQTLGANFTDQQT